MNIAFSDKWNSLAICDIWLIVYTLTSGQFLYWLVSIWRMKFYAMNCFISYWKETNQICQNGARKDVVKDHFFRCRDQCPVSNDKWENTNEDTFTLCKSWVYRIFRQITHQICKCSSKLNRNKNVNARMNTFNMDRMQHII